FAQDPTHGTELWKSDGTDAGTVMVKDINSGSGDGAYGTNNLTPVNGLLYFRATDGVNGWELWRSNGTAAGTDMVKDIDPGSDSSFPRDLTNVNGTLFSPPTSSTPILNSGRATARPTERCWLRVFPPPLRPAMPGT